MPIREGRMRVMNRIPLRLLSLFLCFGLLSSILWVQAHAGVQQEPLPAEFIELFPWVQEPVAQDILLETDTNRGTVLDGKKIMFLGDSILAGCGLYSYEQSWCGMLGTRYGMEYVNNAVSGSTMATSEAELFAPGGSYSPICSRTLPEEDFDVIFVDGGANDWYCAIPLGTDLESRDTMTYIGAMNVLIDRLQSAYPNALILFMTCWNYVDVENKIGVTCDQYNQAMLQLCAARKIPCFEACDEEKSGVFARDPEFRATYFLAEQDYWHMNVSGHQMFLPTIAQWIQEMVMEHYISDAGFYDVYQHDWYADAVTYVKENGITTGITETTFEPATTMQRGMLLTMLYRGAGSPDVTGLQQPFTDLDDTAYYYDAVVWAYNAGIAKGCSDVHFCPDGALTREQLVTFLFRFAELAETDYKMDENMLFSDGEDVSPFAEPAVAWAIENDILHGDNGYIRPRRTATRAEMAQLLMNYFCTGT